MSALDLPPDLRTRLRSLAITPRHPAALTGAGSHASRNKGGGMEFAQYRAYERGDDLRTIDWKLYGRSDRFFVRDAERESPVAVWVVLDASASMGQADLSTPDWSRFDAARRLIVAMVEIALRQGDRFGLIAEASTGPVIVAQGNGPTHRNALLLSLSRLRPGGQADWTRDVAAFGGRLGPSDLIVFLTDGFDEGCVAAAERLALSGRDVCMVRLLTADERDFPFARGYRFVDPETGRERIGDGPLLRADFKRRFAEARQALSARLDRAGIRHVEHFVDEAADVPLRSLFRRSGR